MSAIFISYRRDDAAHAAGRLYDELTKEFGRDSIFMDVDSIPPGVDFVEYLEQKVAACKIMLAVIGAGWIDAAGETGSRRLLNPSDFVHIEIEAALRRGIPVIPVLVDATVMPLAEQLPRPLSKLATRQALRLTHRNFGADLDTALRWLRPMLRDSGRDNSGQQTETGSGQAAEPVPAGARPVPTGERGPAAVTAKSKPVVRATRPIAAPPASPPDIAGIEGSRIKRKWVVDGFEIQHNRATDSGVIDIFSLDDKDRYIAFEKAPAPLEWDLFWKDFYEWTLVEVDDGTIYAVKRVTRSPK